MNEFKRCGVRVRAKWAKKTWCVLQLNSCISRIWEFCVCWLMLLLVCCCSVGRELVIFFLFSHSKASSDCCTSFVFCLMQWMIFFFAAAVVVLLWPCLSNSFHFYRWYICCVFVCHFFRFWSARVSCFCTQAHMCIQTPLEWERETRQNHLNAFLISPHPRQQRRVKTSSYKFQTSIWKMQTILETHSITRAQAGAFSMTLIIFDIECIRRGVASSRNTYTKKEKK